MSPVRAAALWLAATFGLILPVSAQAQTASATIQVDATRNRRPIDPRIYGTAWASTAQLTALRSPLNRWGGNAATRYNWERNADNRAADWYFESIPYASATPGAEADAFVSASRAGAAEPMLTVPIIGWVARVGAGRSKLASFSIAKYGPQADRDWQWFPDAGNGVRSGGGDITGNDPTDASVAVGAAFQRNWVDHLVARFGPASAGGVRYYLLDNEPSIWFSTHRDVRPVGVTLDELRDAMIAHAAAIRAGDPGALIAGPEEWGWSGYFLSGYDHQVGWPYPDRQSHGGWDSLPWLLDQFRQHEQATGQRTLDLFSVHYYPQGGEFGAATDNAMQLRRNRSTRSLWDPNYVDESWIADRVQLIPRLKGWVASHAPGLPVGITEYNWGAEGHINGATAQADILGIFGREGLDLATRWTTPDPATPTFKAIQLYRNYDGSGSGFGDVSVFASGPDPDQVASFAAVRSGDGALTLMLINKQLVQATAATVDLTGFAAAGTAQVYRLTAANSIQRLPDLTLSSGGVSTSLPAQSITLLVMAGSGSPLPVLDVGDASVLEGTGSGASLVFDVTLTPASTQPATVHWATSDGTATTPDDYAAASGDLSFAAGETRKSVGVPLVGDALAEPDEVLYVTLSQPAGASTRDGQGRGTVRDDDGVGASVPVAWTDAAGVSVSGNDLAKTARRNWRNAGARSAQTLAAGDGAVELVASETNLSRVFGLSRGSANLSYKEIDFAIGLMENGQLQVFENGLLRGSFGNYATGDRLRIGVVAGVVQYARNGVVFRTSGVAPRYPLLVDASLYHKRATLQDVRVEGAWH